MKWPWQRKRTVHPTRTCRRILTILREAEFTLPAPDSCYRIRRVNAGPNDRSNGAWSWALEWERDRDYEVATGRTLQRPDISDIGSQFPATECARGAIIDINRFGQAALWPTETQGDGA